MSPTRLPDDPQIIQLKSLFPLQGRGEGLALPSEMLAMGKETASFWSEQWKARESGKEQGKKTNKKLSPVANLPLGAGWGWQLEGLLGWVGAPVPGQARPDTAAVPGFAAPQQPLWDGQVSCRSLVCPRQKRKGLKLHWGISGTLDHLPCQQWRGVRG